MMSRSIVFKPAYWSYEDHIEENELDIHIGGQTADEQTVHLIVWNFKPYIYIELPEKLAWTQGKCRLLYAYLGNIMRPALLGKYEDHAELCQKQKLHYKKDARFLRILVPTHKGGTRLKWRLCGSKSFAIPGLGYFSPGDFQVHEHNIDPIIKFTANQKLKLSDWLTVVETIPEGEESATPDTRKFSTADIDMYCDWQDVEPAAAPAVPLKRPLPTFLSFDIECYSANPNAKLPDASLESNVVFQIGCIVGKFKRLPWKKVLFSLQDPADIPEVEIRRFRSERDLLLEFAAFIRTVDPDIFIGYNILGFDWPYLLARATVCGVLAAFKMIGRLSHIPALIKQVKWTSGAYGEQNYDYPDAQGRIHIDVMKEVQREYRLSSYSLNAVSDHFLGRRKDDITPRQLFMLYKGSVELKGAVADATFPSAVRRVLIKRFVHGEVKNLRTALLKARTPKMRLSLIRQLLKLVGLYCIQDTLLPILLCERLNLWETMEALSNCMSVPLAYLHSRGQQIKVLAQVYREILPLNMVIPFFPKNETDPERFQGAVVIDAREGFYDRVALLDFLSLYPTLIIAFNICYTTIVPDTDPTPDEECHVLQWEDHVGCVHDSKKRKKKAADVLCQAKRYRFRRVKIASDGSRLDEGVLPALERRLLTERGKIKKDLARVNVRLAASLSETEKQDLEISRNILDANQKALKVSANSAYGAMGARTGFMPLLIGAASVTAMGRKLITMAIDHIKSHYETSRLVYGDSVTSDTPLLIKYVDGLVDITTIETLFENTHGTQKPYDQFKPFDPDGERIHKEKTEFDGEEKFQVWSWGELPAAERRAERLAAGGKWATITKVIRHKTNKKMYRVNTHTGCVDVTEDHSLLRPNGDKIKPAELKVGEPLLHSFPVFNTGGDDSFYDSKTNELFVPTTVGEKKAFIYGCFYGDGSCGKSVSKWSWVLNTRDRPSDAVHHLLGYLEDVYLDDFSGVYEIVPCGGDIKKYVLEYRSQFYDKDSLKKVPRCMLNGAVNIRKAFMSGYTALKPSKDEHCFFHQGKIGSQGLYYMCKSLGYSCSVRPERQRGYRVNSSHPGLFEASLRPPGAVEKIIALPPVTEDTFVYDIETDEGKFHCGVGEIVAKNTDSCMIRFEGADVEESFRLARVASRSATHYIKSSILGVPEDYRVGGKRLGDFDLAEVKLGDADTLKKLEYDSIPIDLEFEDMFGKYLLLTQKRYAGHVINIEGDKIKDVKKGIVLARRDNCAMLKTIYGRLLDAVLESLPEDAVLEILYGEIEKVYTRQIPDPQFIIYLGVNNVLSYAQTDGQGRFIRTDGSLIVGVDDPLDSRLVYPHLRQVMLALRMLKRGDSIPAGTRLEFVFVIRPQALFEGDRLEDYDFYRENRKGPKGLALDIDHYIEKQILKPVTELLNVAFPHEMVSAVPIKDRFEGNSFEELGEYQLCILKQKGNTRAKVFHVLESANRFDFLGKTQCPTGVRLGSGDPCGCVSRYSGGGRNDVNRVKHPQIVALCQQFRSWDVVARLQKQSGLPKSRTRRKGLARGATEYPRDSNVVGDILQARRVFRKVVVELNVYSLHKFYN